MHWEKKICIRITLRRIVGTILAASTVVNLVIAGVVFGADSPAPAPTVTWVPVTSLATSTFSTSPATAKEASPSASTDIPAVSSTDTPGIAPTDTSTPTQTSIDLPGWTLCIKKFYWPGHRVVYGDTLFSLALATRSTLTELISANCLTSSQIYAGQLLYVPRLPGQPSSPTPTTTGMPTITPTNTDTPTDTLTPSPTPTATPTETPSPTPTPTPSPTDTPVPTPTDTPTEFQISEGMTCDPLRSADFSVTVFDPDGIFSVVVMLFTDEDVFIVEIPLRFVGGAYSGSTSLPDQYTVYDIGYYQFHALDRLGRPGESKIYRERAGNCLPSVELN